MARMYIESDNGGRAVALTTGGRWFIFGCMPSGCTAARARPESVG